MCHVVPGQEILLTAPEAEHHPTPPVQRQLHISRNVPWAPQNMAAGNGYQEQNTGSDSSKLPAPYRIAGAVQPLERGSRWLAVQVDSSRAELGRSTVHSLRGKHRFVAAWAGFYCAAPALPVVVTAVVGMCSHAQAQNASACYPSYMSGPEHSLLGACSFGRFGVLFFWACSFGRFGVRMHLPAAYGYPIRFSCCASTGIEC